MQLKKAALCVALCGAILGCGKDYSGTAAKDISDSDPTKRIEAIGRMSQLIGTDSSAVGVVLKGLRDSDENVQLAAADALGNATANVGSVIDGLHEALNSDASVAVKLRCLEALKKLSLSGVVSAEEDMKKVKAIAKEAAGSSNIAIACGGGVLACALGDPSQVLSLLEKAVAASAGKDSSSDEVKGAQALLGALQEGNPDKSIQPKIEALKATPNLNTDLANGLEELLIRLEGGGGGGGGQRDDLGPR